VQETGITLSVGHVSRLIAEPPSAPLELQEALHEVAEPAAVETIAEVAEVESVGTEPDVVLPKGVRGSDMGIALYYPALSALGLLEAVHEQFLLPRSERFGVRATMMTVFFLTLLGKTTVESAKHLSRSSFGAVLGCQRAPSVKTLRRKLRALVEQKSSSAFGESLSRHWVNSGFIAGAYLYVDGHMKVYTGKRHLQEIWNSQRRMPLPGVISYFVGDQQGRPLLFITDDVFPSLSKSMPRIVDAIRAVVGDRRFTVIFDRGGYDGNLFSWLVSQGIDFITYQRGASDLPLEHFARRETRIEGKRFRFWAAEDTVCIAKAGPWRRVVIRTPSDGHQTPILTSLASDQIGTARIAWLIFARWRQENFFRYMRHRQGLDQLVSYLWDDVPDATMPNPQRNRLQKAIAAKRQRAIVLREMVAEAALHTPLPSSRSALKKKDREVIAELRLVDLEIDELVATRRACPPQVLVSETGQMRHAMRLEYKTLVDRIKITGYNAEEWMLDRLQRHYANAHDVRDLLRAFGRLGGEMTSTGEGVVITLDPPDTPTHRRALRGLCDELNHEHPTYPGTTIPVVYRTAVHHSEAEFRA
jgi:hypothetical protein